MVQGYGRKFFVLLCLFSSTKADLKGKCDNPWERVKLVKASYLAEGIVLDHEDGTIYPKGAYREEYGENETLAVFGCPCMLDKPCLRKCCLKDQAMDNNTLKCIPVDDPWPWFRPLVPIDANGSMVEASHDHFRLTYGIFCAGPLIVAEPKFYPNKDRFYLNLLDGKLTLFQKNKYGLWVDEFCLEYFPATDDYLPIRCRKPKRRPKHGICYHVRYVVYPTAFSVSVFFLAISLLVYGSLPELQNMHGKCLICHMISTLVAYLALAAVQGLGKNFSDVVCVTFGFIVYFAILCTFFWLNVVCIDIFLAFRGMQPARRTSQQRKRFLLYMAYAWGLPLIILIVALFMELSPDLPEWVLKPEFKWNCWIRGNASKLAYFIIPIGVIVLCNAVLFLTTASTISRVRKETEVLRKGDSKKHKRAGDQHEDKARFKLYVKLSVIMGISWVSEIVSYAVGGSECNWFFTDLINILQGVFIFFIFVCKNKVKNMIVKKLGPSFGNQRWSFLRSISSSGRTSSSKCEDQGFSQQ